MIFRIFMKYIEIRGKHTKKFKWPDENVRRKELLGLDAFNDQKIFALSEESLLNWVATDM